MDSSFIKFNKGNVPSMMDTWQGLRDITSTESLSCGPRTCRIDIFVHHISNSYLLILVIVNDSVRKHLIGKKKFIFQIFIFNNFSINNKLIMETFQFL